MSTPIIMHASQPSRDCIVEAGRRYCESPDVSARVIAIAVLMISAWFALIIWGGIWALDGGSRWRWLLPGGVSLAPLILAIVFGGSS